MQLSLDTFQHPLIIRSCDDEKITVGEEAYTHSLMITPKGVVSDWGCDCIEKLTQAHIEALLDDAPDLIILGTGDKHRFLDEALLSPLYAANIGVEVMSTVSACKTYNLLVSDGRKVNAGLMLTLKKVSTS